MSTQPQQPPRMQLGSLADYHDLAAFQAFTLMKTQMALADKDQQIQQLAQQLAEARAQVADLQKGQP